MDIKHLPQWALSAGQRPIELYHNPNCHGANLKSPLVFIGGVHGDEPEGVRLALDLIEYLKLPENSALNRPWAVIPCLNPDGFKHNSRVNKNGVDLNRNFPASNWSAEYSKKRYFPGPSPGSEPEVKALVELILNLKPQVIFHFHSWEPCVVLTGEPALKHAQCLSQSSGYELKNNIGYPTPGSLSHYAWVDHKIPVICTEEQEHSDLNKTWSNFGPGLIKILKY